MNTLKRLLWFAADIVSWSFIVLLAAIAAVIGIVASVTLAILFIFCTLFLFVALRDFTAEKLSELLQGENE